MLEANNQSATPSAAPVVNSSPSVSTGSSPAAAPSPTDNSGVSPDVQKIVNFDFFGAEGTPVNGTKTGEGTTPPEGQVVDGADGAKSKPATPATTEVPVVPTESPETLLLKEQNEAFKAQLAELQAKLGEGGGAPAKPADASAQPPAPEALPDYTFTIPDPLMQALNSEDMGDRKQGLVMLTQGVAKGIHQTVMAQARKELEAAIPTILRGAVEAIQSQTRAVKAQEDMQSDFYGKFKEYNKPELKTIVGGLAVQLAKEKGIQSWTPAFRDALGERVKNFLASVGAVPQAQPTIMGGGSRPAVEKLSDEQKDMQEMLTSGF